MQFNGSLVRNDEFVTYSKVPRRSNWTPFAIRTVFLVIVTVTLVLCIAALEVIVRRATPLGIPSATETVQHHARSLMFNTHSYTYMAKSRTTWKRQYLNTTTSPEAYAATTESTSATGSLPSAGGADPSDYLSFNPSTITASEITTTTPPYPSDTSDTDTDIVYSVVYGSVGGDYTHTLGAGSPPVYLTLDPSEASTTTFAAMAPASMTSAYIVISITTPFDNGAQSTTTRSMLQVGKPADTSMVESTIAANPPAVTISDGITGHYMSISHASSTVPAELLSHPVTPTIYLALPDYTTPAAPIPIEVSQSAPHTSDMGSMVGLGSQSEPTSSPVASAITAIFTSEGQLVTSTITIKPSTIESVVTTDGVPTTSTIVVWPSPTIQTPYSVISVWTSNGAPMTSTVLVQPSPVISSPSAIVSIWTSASEVITSTLLAYQSPLPLEPSTIVSIFTSNGQILTSTDTILPTTALAEYTSDGKVITTTVTGYPSTVVSVETSNGELITTTMVLIPVVSARRFPESTGSASTQVVSDPVGPDLQVKEIHTEFSYFAALVLPSIIAVILKEAWAMVSSSLKMMEPFYLLNHAQGATVGEALMFDYLSATTSWCSLKAMLKGNGIMTVVFLVNVVMSLLAPVAAESMPIIALTKHTRSDGTTRRTDPAWVVRLSLVRVLQTMLSLVAVITFTVFVFCKRRRSGLSANPSRISTMAALLNHPSVLQNIQNIPSNTTNKGIEQSLGHHRYMMADYCDFYGNTRCGLVKVDESFLEGTHKAPLEDLVSPMVFADLSEPNEQNNHHRIHRTTAQRTWDTLFLILITALLGVIVAYRIDMSNSGFNRFFNSGKFGPRFILSLTASLITIELQNLEREVRLTTPYRQLALGRAAPRSTILRSVNGTALSTLYQSFRHGSWYHVFMALTTLLGDLLIITVTGVPFADSLTWEAFEISCYASITIIVLMLTAAVSINWWRWQNVKMGIPQQPNGNLLRIWMSLSNQENKLRTELSNIGYMDEGATTAFFKQDESLYCAGWIKDEHGRNMWCVDKEQDTACIGV